MADAGDLKSFAARLVGSSPTAPTISFGADTLRWDENREVARLLRSPAVRARSARRESVARSAAREYLRPYHYHLNEDPLRIDFHFELLLTSILISGR